jgi:imidazolonepropionase-like amidohydrolase
MHGRATAQELVRSRADAEERGHRAVEALPEEAAPSFVLEGGTVLTAAGQRFEPGYVVVVDGRIMAVGPGSASVTPGARVIDAAGRFITPGLIDAHSHLGVYPAPALTAHSDGNEATSPVTAGVWAEHGLWPQDPGIERAVAGGTTTMLVLPGSANLIGGRGVTVHLVPARGSRAMRFPGAPDVLKMACGENPKRVYGQKAGGPGTRMGNVRGQRDAFFSAQKYREEWRRYREKQEKQEKQEKEQERPASRKSKPADDRARQEPPDLPPARDLGLETLAEALDGRVLVQVHCYRSDDMLNMIQLAEEVGFKIRTFHHALEAYKIRDILAAREIAVATWADWWGFKIEAYDGIEQSAALLAEAGVRTAIKSDSPIDIQRLNQEAGKALASAVHAGLPLTEDDALRMVTANPAWALGIESEVGTIESGKRADLVVWDRHPFSVYARAELVFVDGRLRYDRERNEVPWSDFMLGQEAEP